MEKPDSFFFNFFRRLFNSLQSPPEPLPIPGRPRGIVHLETSYAINNAHLLKQLYEAKKYRSFIEEGANVYDLLPSIICGIGSRESQWGLTLRPPIPSGRGDFAKRPPRGDRITPEPPDGPGYGRGLMQIDYDWHEFARTGYWQSPRENILYACSLVAKFRRSLEERKLPETLLLRAAIAAYNGGLTNVIRAYQERIEIDSYTTGKDYSRDVFNRAGWFQLHGWR